MKKIKRFLLNWVGEKIITEYLILKSNPEESSVQDSLWSEVFFRVPSLKGWLKKRELQLLKNARVSEKSSDFINGQIFENLLYQHFDVPRPDLAPEQKVADKETIIDRSTFITKWNNEKNAEEKTEKIRQEGSAEKI